MASGKPSWKQLEDMYWDAIKVVNKQRKLLEKLNDWTEHHVSCDMYNCMDDVPVVCTCGLDEFREENKL